METLRKNINYQDLIGSIIFLIAGLILFRQAQLISSKESSMFVFLVLGLYFAMSIFIFVKSFFSKDKVSYIRIYSIKSICILLLLLILRIGIEYIGFYYSAFPFILLVTLLCYNSITKKCIITSVILSLVSTVILYILCEFCLSISF